MSSYVSNREVLEINSIGQLRKDFAENSNLIAIIIDKSIMEDKN